MRSTEIGPFPARTGVVSVATGSWPPYFEDVKTTSFTVDGCPQQVHDALRKSSAINNRSINRETLDWLQEKAEERTVVTCAEVAEILRRAEEGLSDDDRRRIADGVEAARRRMNAEHLYHR